MIETMLERIALALEAIVKSQGIVAETVAPKPAVQQDLPLDPSDDDNLDEIEEEEDLDELEDDNLDDDLDDDLDDGPPAPRKKKSSKKKAKKKTLKKTRIGTEDVATSEYTADEVRAKLKDLQLATGSAARAKSIMKKHGASTFGQLKVGRYDAVVRDVDVQLED